MVMIRTAQMNTPQFAELAKRIQALEALLVISPPATFAPELVARKIKELVALRFLVTIEALEGRRRTEKIVLPRFIAIHLIRKWTGLSSTEIGCLFNRDHGSILNALTQVSRLTNYPAHRDAVAALDREISTWKSSQPSTQNAPTAAAAVG
jgi:hypothetical protein